MAVAEPYAPPSVGTLRGRVVVRARTRRRSRAAVLDRIAIGLLLGITVMALLTPLIAPYKPNLIAGRSFVGPGRHFLLGTDEVGRDILSRVLYGLRTSWFASLEIIASGVVIGGLIGLVAGATGGWVDDVLMRITDVFLALPSPILAIAVVAALGPLRLSASRGEVRIISTSRRPKRSLARSKAESLAAPISWGRLLISSRA